MNVKELREELAKYPDDMRIFSYDSAWLKYGLFDSARRVDKNKIFELLNIEQCEASDGEKVLLLSQ